MRAVDEAAVRALIARLVDVDGSAVFDDGQIGSVSIDEDWLTVVLGVEEVPRERLALLYAHLKQALPSVEVEIRTGGRVFRGGSGFGLKRHVVAVLGGKGSVGKNKLADNMELNLATKGIRVS